MTVITVMTPDRTTRSGVSGSSVSIWGVGARFLRADDENDGMHMNTKAPLFSVIRVVMLTALLATAACNATWWREGVSDLLPEPRADKGSPATGRNVKATEGYGLKPVHGKEDPGTLIARDGTTCTV